LLGHKNALFSNVYLKTALFKKWRENNMKAKGDDKLHITV
jgi:hypothetical protein